MVEPLSFDVRADAEYVAGRAKFVRIDRDVLMAWAQRVNPSDIHSIRRPVELMLAATVEELANWTLLLDSLNFCFWTDDAEPWEVDYLGRAWRRYYALRAALHRAACLDRGWLRPDRWASASPAEVQALFAGRGQIPMLDERLRIINETGRVLCDRFDGETLALLRQADFDAVRIAGAVACNFESFRDVHTYNGERVAVLKRAQILAADLAEALQHVSGPPVLHLEGLTAFADYRIPQALRHLGILVLDPQLERRIEARELVPASSLEEIELRACGIHAVEAMVSALAGLHGAEKPAWTVDEYLWELSHDYRVRVQHHRTLTVYY